MLYRKSKLTNTFVLLMIGMIAMAFTVPAAFAEDSDPWTDIPEELVIDWGEMWGNTIGFEYTYDPEIGNMAQTIEWDFGDGSERSTEWNPQHTYTELGTYNVVQHVTNTYEGFSEDWGYYRLTIMGKPYVEIITPEGADPMERVYATKGTVPEMPETDPVWEGHTFMGYFVDPEKTVPWEWTFSIDVPVTVYAAFSGEGTGPVPVDPDESDGDDDSVLTVSSTMLSLLLVGVVLGLVALYYKNPVMSIIALIILLGALLGLIGIIDVPDVFERLI